MSDSRESSALLFNMKSVLFQLHLAHLCDKLTSTLAKLLHFIYVCSCVRESDTLFVLKLVYVTASCQLNAVSL
jgi:hypothetical protein